jgi:NAD(P)H dehydrogenase (quinone)
MVASVIVAHPYDRSFNQAIFKSACLRLKNLNITTHAHDLYAENFNPLLTLDELGSDLSRDKLVNQYARELLESDILIIIHPNWWGQPPAILKGYIDRVFRPTYCYDFPPGDSGGGIAIGKLQGKCGIVFNTSNTAEEREEKYFGDPLESIWKQCVFDFCGITNYYRKTFKIIADSTEAQRKQWLMEVEKTIDTIIRTFNEGTR